MTAPTRSNPGRINARAKVSLPPVSYLDYFYVPTRRRAHTKGNTPTTKRKANERIPLPAGIAVFPRLGLPADTKFDADGIFHTKVRFTAADVEAIRELRSAAMVEARAMMEAAIREANPKAVPKRIEQLLAEVNEHDPFSEELDKETGDATGFFLVAFRKKHKVKDQKNPGEMITLAPPPIFDAKGTNITAIVNGGSTIRPSVVLSPYFQPGKKEYGVAMRLEAVQVIKMAQRGGMGPSDADDFGFDAVEGGYEAPSENEAPGTPPATDF